MFYHSRLVWVRSAFSLNPQAFCCYGATKLEVDDTDEAFIPDGSYLIDTNNARERREINGFNDFHDFVAFEKMAAAVCTDWS